MINIGAIIRFWSKFLGFHGFLLVGVFLLAVLTEIIIQPGQMMTLTFWTDVGLDMLPAIGLVLIVLRLASRFMQAVYNLPSKWEGFQFLIRSRFGRPKFGPFIKVEHGLLSANTNNVLVRIGGPGNLIVSNDSAVVLEQEGRLTRVEGPGFINLEPFEKVYEAIDLRPKRCVSSVKAMTKEGILITWEVEVRYQIADGGQQPSEKTPYPFSKDDVFRAAICRRRRVVDGVGDVVNWENLVLLRTVGVLRSILVNYTLDQLIGLTDTAISITREAIEENLARNLPQQVNELGVKILGVELNNLQVCDSVTQQWIKDWQTRWQQAAALKFELTETDKFTLHEMAKNEAQRLLRTTFSNELEKQDSNQVITFMVLIHFLFGVEGRVRSTAVDQLFSSNLQNSNHIPT